MQFTQLFDDDRAVSPVIGVILMVAITVILAAVIGTFVLGMSDQMGDTSPRASFGFDYDSAAGDVVVTHETGASINAADLKVTGGGGAVFADDNADGKISAGESATATSASAGDTIRVVYTNPDSGDTTTLQKFEVPS